MMSLVYSFGLPLLYSGPVVCHNVILIITIPVKITEMIISVLNVRSSHLLSELINYAVTQFPCCRP